MFKCEVTTSNYKHVVLMYKSLILKSIEFNLRIVLSAAMGWTVFLSSDLFFIFITIVLCMRGQKMPLSLSYWNTPLGKKQAS